MKTPNDLSDAEVNDLVENNRLPMSKQGKALFDFGMSMLRALTPPKPRTTLVFEQIPYGRGRWGWACYDSNIYDGPESDIGSGATKEEALADYEERLEAERLKAAIQNRYELIPGTQSSSEPGDYKPVPSNHHEIEEPQ